MTNETPAQQPAPRPPWRRISEVVRDPSIWQDLDRVELEQLEGSDFVVHDVMFLRGSMGDVPGDFAVMLITNPDDGEVETWLANGVTVPQGALTTMCGGIVAVRKLKQIMGIDPPGKNQLPLLMSAAKRTNKIGKYDYWDLT